MKQLCLRVLLSVVSLKSRPVICSLCNLACSFMKNVCKVLLVLYIHSNKTNGKPSYDSYMQIWLHHPTLSLDILLNQIVSEGDRGVHIYMQVRHPHTAVSHDYMPLKRYCSLCLVGKHLSRDVTLAADKDSDLCIILCVNISQTVWLYNFRVLKK